MKVHQPGPSQRSQQKSQTTGVWGKADKGRQGAERILRVLNHN